MPALAQLPVQTARTNFKPVGADLAAQGPSASREMNANYDRATEADQASAFEKHLQTGLQGMQQVFAELPPDVQAAVGDPQAYSVSDDKRLLWYQGVNVAINRQNMKQAAASGDISGAENLSLNDPKASPQDFTRVATSRAFAETGKDLTLTEEVTSQEQKPQQGLADVFKAQEAAKRPDGTPDYKTIHGNYTKKEDADAMANGDIALGAYGIVPKFWFKDIGLDPKNEEDRRVFLESPELQDQAFEGVIDSLTSQYDGSMDKAIAHYYGGPDGAAAFGTPAGDKPAKIPGHPTVNQYVNQVKARMAQAGITGTMTSTKTETKDKSKITLAQEILRKDPRLLKEMQPVLDMMGKPADDIAMLKLAQGDRKEAGLDRRSTDNRAIRKEMFEADRLDKLGKTLTTGEYPKIATALQDIDAIMAPGGGLKNVFNKLPSAGYLERNLPTLFKDTEAAKINSLLNTVYSLELKRISGVAVSDAEFNRFQQVFLSGDKLSSASPEEQLFALASFVRGFRSWAKLSRARHGQKAWDSLAKEIGLDIDDLPEVPDALTSFLAEKVQDKKSGKKAGDQAAPGTAPAAGGLTERQRRIAELNQKKADGTLGKKP